jgi:hypothetical protein
MELFSQFPKCAMFIVKYNDVNKMDDKVFKYMIINIVVIHTIITSGDFDKTYKGLSHNTDVIDNILLMFLQNFKFAYEGIIRLQKINMDKMISNDTVEIIKTVKKLKPRTFITEALSKMRAT